MAEQSLVGKVALVLGVANNQSIAYGVAKSLRARGATIVMPYQTDRTRDFIAPIFEELGVELAMKCDVTEAGSLEAVFEAIKQKYGKLDIGVHSIAFAPREDLHGRIVDISAEGFKMALDVSCHSFIRMAKLAEPMMIDGGTLLTMSYYGSARVVPTYGIMGPIKAALECSVKYLAYDLGPKKIRVHAVSPGPIKTRAGSGIREFDALIEQSAQAAPLKELADIFDVGETSAFLCEPGAALLTGSVMYVDGGTNIMS
jgi:enoyl-[acyl-carrier protein] reductase I